MNYTQFKEDQLNGIFEKKPHWLIRYGISVLFSIVVIFLLCSIFITYPECKNNDCILKIKNKKTSVYTVCFKSTSHCTITKGKIIQLALKDIHGKGISKATAIPLSTKSVQSGEYVEMHMTVDMATQFQDSSDIRAVVHLPVKNSSLFYRLFKEKIDIVPQPSAS